MKERKILVKTRVAMNVVRSDTLHLNAINEDVWIKTPRINGKVTGT
jgi:hypothetical protein